MPPMKNVLALCALSLSSVSFAQLNSNDITTCKSSDGSTLKITQPNDVQSAPAQIELTQGNEVKTFLSIPLSSDKPDVTLYPFLSGSVLEKTTKFSAPACPRCSGSYKVSVIWKEKSGDPVEFECPSWTL